MDAPRDSTDRKTALTTSTSATRGRRIAAAVLATAAIGLAAACSMAVDQSAPATSAATLSTANRPTTAAPETSSETPAEPRLTPSQVLSSQVLSSQVLSSQVLSSTAWEATDATDEDGKHVALTTTIPARSRLSRAAVRHAAVCQAVSSEPAMRLSAEVPL
jgi:hypothetical protein